MNATFLTRTWPDFISQLSSRFPGFLAHLGWTVPLAELAVAIGLSIRRTRRIAVIAAVTMHALILVVLMATGENSVVWPWNVAMAGLTLA